MNHWITFLDENESTYVSHFHTVMQALVMCLRLHFTKDSTTINTAAAAIKQLVSIIFDRVVAEDKIPTTGKHV